MRPGIKIKRGAVAGRLPVVLRARAEYHSDVGSDGQIGKREVAYGDTSYDGRLTGQWKTTEAIKLEQKYRALRLMPDEWQYVLFGHDVSDPEHDERHTRLQEKIWLVGKSPESQKALQTRRTHKMNVTE